MSQGDIAAVKTRPRRPWLRPVLLLAGVAAVMLLSWKFHVGDRISGLQGRIGDFGAWGPVVFILLYIGATVAALPGTVPWTTAPAFTSAFLAVSSSR